FLMTVFSLTLFRFQNRTATGTAFEFLEGYVNIGQPKDALELS
ncbi:11447_t:CDS:1, partial [Ambispora gerdemannii]